MHEHLSTQEGRQRLIDTFINALYLYDDKLKYVCNFKDGTMTKRKIRIIMQ